MMGEPGWAAESQPIADVGTLSERIDRLTERVEALVGLVEELFDRVVPASEATPVTAEELADIAARLVRLIESRLDAYSERIQQSIGELVARTSRDDIDLTDPAQQQQLALLDDHLALVGRAVLDVKQGVANIESSTSASLHEREALLRHVLARLDELGRSAASAF